MAIKIGGSLRWPSPAVWCLCPGLRGSRPSRVAGQLVVVCPFIERWNLSTGAAKQNPDVKRKRKSNYPSSPSLLFHSCPPLGRPVLSFLSRTTGQRTSKNRLPTHRHRLGVPRPSSQVMTSRTSRTHRGLLAVKTCLNSSEQRFSWHQGGLGAGRNLQCTVSMHVVAKYFVPGVFSAFIDVLRGPAEGSMQWPQHERL